MAAALLAEGESRLERIPELADVATLGRLLEHLGAKVGRDGRGMCIDTSKITEREAPYELVKTMRASVLVLGPLVGRYGYARVSLPGGCAIGARPIDQHLMGLEKMGAEVTLEHGYVTVNAKRLKGARIVLDMATVTGTENLMMAACLAEGTTVIENAAREPEVSDLANCLVSMGAKIEGIGSAVLTIEGSDTLAPFSHDPVSDRIEAGTFMVAAAITGSELTIEGASLGHLDALTQKLTEAGVMVAAGEGGSIVVRGGGNLTGVNFVTSPHPGFPTDMQAQLMALMSLAKGTSVVRERIFENRYMHVAELQRMGADIHLEGTVATITGVEKFSGANVMATDLRASAALVLAGLAAEGETVISRVYHLDRGYEKLEAKLSQVGARITRISQ
jgi:UDP-N-acetylglucosamine 1-carboxyvinyltransferase